MAFEAMRAGGEADDPGAGGECAGHADLRIFEDHATPYVHAEFAGGTEDLVEGTGPEGTSSWVKLLVRLSRAPVVSIAVIRGYTRGAGLEFARACDLQFGSNAELSGEIDATASLLARFDHEAVARTKASA